MVQFLFLVGVSEHRFQSFSNIWKLRNLERVRFFFIKKCISIVRSIPMYSTIFAILATKPRMSKLRYLNVYIIFSIKDSEPGMETIHPKYKIKRILSKNTDLLLPSVRHLL